MKKLFYSLFLTVLFLSCGNNPKSNKADSQSTEVAQGDRIEVIYFHGAQRCITCRAIEEHTKALLENVYAQELENGTVVYRTIDISKKENKEIADKYEVTWSSLFINKWADGKETPNNMTDFAFSYAKGSPDKFTAGIREKIEELKN